MAAATASPEPKGTLTPPGSSPLRAECDPTRDSSHNSTPLSPEAPPTPDSAHMANEPTNHSAARLQPTSEREESNILTNQEPLSGAKKRKAAKVHKVEVRALFFLLLPPPYFRPSPTSAGSWSLPMDTGAVFGVTSRRSVEVAATPRAVSEASPSVRDQCAVTGGGATTCSSSSSSMRLCLCLCTQMDYCTHGASTILGSTSP